MATPTAPALDVDRVEVVYGKARAVNGATVRVPEASITAIVGPNGAGKTSLLRAVSGLLPVPPGRSAFAAAASMDSPSARSRRSASRTSRRAGGSSRR